MNRSERERIAKLLKNRKGHSEPNLFSISEYYDHYGIATLPIKAARDCKKPHKGKEPAVSRWEQFQKTAPTREHRRRWFENKNHPGIAAILGRSSGGLICLDIDDRRSLQLVMGLPDLSADVRDLIKQTYISRTPRGYQVFFRSKSFSGRKVLGQEENSLTGRKEVFIELRGEGCYVVLPGSRPECHPLNTSYSIGKGNIENVAEIDDDQLQELIRVFSKFDLITDEPVDPATRDYYGRRQLSEAQQDVIRSICELHLDQVSVNDNGFLSACCPYHNDSNPSFWVNVTTGSFGCSACGARGWKFSELDRQLKQDRTNVWRHYDAQGVPFGEIRRVVKGGKKTDIPCYKADGNGGFDSGIPAELKKNAYPLFGLETLSSAARPLYVVEGQKCHRVMASLGLECVTSILGASNANKSLLCACGDGG